MCNISNYFEVLEMAYNSIEQIKAYETFFALKLSTVRYFYIFFY